MEKKVLVLIDRVITYLEMNPEKNDFGFYENAY